MGIFDDFIAGVRQSLQKSEAAAQESKVRLQQQRQVLEKRAVETARLPTPPPTPTRAPTPAKAVTEAVAAGRAAAQRRIGGGPSVSPAPQVITGAQIIEQRKEVEEILEPKGPTKVTIQQFQSGQQIIKREPAALIDVAPGPFAGPEERFEFTKQVGTLAVQRAAQIPRAIVETPIFARALIRRPVETVTETGKEIIRDPTHLITIFGAGKVIKGVTPKAPKVRLKKLAAATEIKVDITGKKPGEILGVGRGISETMIGKRQVITEPVFRFKQIETGTKTAVAAELGGITTTVKRPTIIGKGKKVKITKEPFIAGAQAVEILKGIDISRARIKTPRGPLIKSMAITKKIGEFPAESKQFFAGFAEARAPGIRIREVHKIRVKDLTARRPEAFFTLPSGVKLFKKPKTPKLKLGALTAGIQAVAVKRALPKPAKFPKIPIGFTVPKPKKVKVKTLPAQIPKVKTKPPRVKVGKKLRVSPAQITQQLSQQLTGQTQAQRQVQKQVQRQQQKQIQKQVSTQKQIQRQAQKQLQKQRQILRRGLKVSGARPRAFPRGFPRTIRGFGVPIGLPRKKRVKRIKVRRKRAKPSKLVSKVLPSLTAGIFRLRRKKPIPKGFKFTGLEVRLLPRKKRVKKRKRTKKRRRKRR